MRILRLIICLSICYATIGSVNAQKNFANDADNAFLNESYFSAIDYYKKADVKAKPAEKARINFKIGESYRFMVDPAQAETYYSKAIKLHYDAVDPIVFLHMASVKKQQGEYKEAKTYYEQYLAKKPGDKVAEDGLGSCKKAIVWLSEPTKHIVQNEIQLNTESYDYSSTWGDKKHNVIIFSSSRPGSTGDAMDERTGESFMDLWTTTRDNKGKWDEPKILPEQINTEDNEGGAVLTKKGDKIFFTRCPREKKENIGCDIFFSEVQGSNWKPAEMIILKPEGADSLSCGHPAIDKSEKFMIFASDLLGGQGGKDLWLTEYDKRESKWMTPVNLGATINTAGDEMFPYLTEEGNLYFSSTGHVGMGGLDIFRAEKTAEMKWENIENLRYPINSAEHDYGIIFEKGSNDNRGYFTSSRAEGKGKDDLYSFNLPEVKFELEVYVKDKATQAPIPGVQITLVGSDGTQVVKTTDEEGKFFFIENGSGRFIAKDISYSLETTKNDFLVAKSKFSTVGEANSKKYIEEVFMQPASKDVVIDFPEVQYAYDKSDLLVDDRINSRDSLDYLYSTLMENPTIKIELQAHTDCRGSDSYNMKLSQRRAEACVTYLVSKGIPADRMVAKGYGEVQPRAVGLECKTIEDMATKQEQEVAHQKNRRTQFRVLSFTYKPAGE
jgi:peptidoglycan-associated lipoprotein